jgi:hypothetical protein
LRGVITSSGEFFISPSPRFAMKRLNPRLDDSGRQFNASVRK